MCGLIIIFYSLMHVPDREPLNFSEELNLVYSFPIVQTPSISHSHVEIHIVCLDQALILTSIRTSE